MRLPAGVDPDLALAEHGGVVASLLRAALLALSYLNYAGVTLRPCESERCPVHTYILDPGELIRLMRN